MYLEAPKDQHIKGHSLFLGGGISNCPDWQKDIRDILEPALPNVLLINPRRYDFDIHNPDATIQQIHWEFRYLDLSEIILFWFPKATLCPITLLEFGKFMMTGKPLFVGTEPGYQRNIDVEIQAQLQRPEIKVVNSLTDLASQVIAHFDDIRGKPYLEVHSIETTRNYNPDYGDDRICKCGHPYYRHFDTYEGMSPVGCKYCGCYTFVEKADPLPEGQHCRNDPRFDQHCHYPDCDCRRPGDTEGLWKPNWTT